MKSLLAAILMVLIALSSLPAFAKTAPQGKGQKLTYQGKKAYWKKKKGTKIAKHFSPSRQAKLKKWQQGEVKRKIGPKYKQYFSGIKKHGKKRG